MKLRDQAIDRLRAYQLDVEASIVVPQHPLAGIMETPPSPRRKHTGNRVHAVETRATGRSRVPIRGLSPQGNEMAHWLRFIRDNLDVRYAAALETWAELGTFDAVAKKMAVSRRTAQGYFDAGLVVIQIRLLEG